MKLIRTEDAAGQVLCHDITQILPGEFKGPRFRKGHICLLYTSDAADEEDSVDLGGPRIIKKKNSKGTEEASTSHK